MTLPPPLVSQESEPATAQTAPVIEMKGVTKVYGDQVALDNVDLTVPAGVILGLIGPSGCGKTTLVKLLTGIVRPTSGSVRVLGADPVDFGVSHRRRFGYMPQLPVLFPNLTVWGNMGFISSVYGMSLRNRRARLKELLDLVDLGQHRHKLLSECSGGMQRRLTLASTLVHDPELLFLDEPTAGVDPILRERFWDHFRSLRDQGRTVVVPTQYVGEAVTCDLVAVMATGRLITVLPPDQLAHFAYGGVPLAVDVQDGWLAGSELARLADQPFVRGVRRTEQGLVVVVDDPRTDTTHVQQLLHHANVQLGGIEPLEPSFDDIFVQIIQTNTTRAERAEL